MITVEILYKKNIAMLVATSMPTALTMPYEISFEVIVLVFKYVINNIGTHF